MTGNNMRSSKYTMFLYDAWIIIGICFFYFFLFEGMTRLYHWIRVSPINNSNDLNFAYYPYVGFRSIAIHKPKLNVNDPNYNPLYIPLNVDENGVREPGFPAEQGAQCQVWMFGGSTVFGAGVKDEETIPEYLNGFLKKQGFSVFTTNYGSGWWSSTQSVVQLMLKLQSGRRPETVIFYEGINDVNVVAYGGKPGGIAPEAEILMRKAIAKTPVSLTEWLFTHSDLVDTLNRKLHPLVLSGKAKKAVDYEVDNKIADRLNDEAEVERLASEIARCYEENIRMVSVLASAMHFNAYFMLQPFPLVADRGSFTGDLQYYSGRKQSRPRDAILIDATYRKIRESDYLKTNPSFFNMEDALKDVQESISIDSEHFNPKGNRVMASKILKRLAESEKKLCH